MNNYYLNENVINYNNNHYIELICPITKNIMYEPVIADDNITYEKKAIEQWIKINSISPITRQKISNNLKVDHIKVIKIIEYLNNFFLNNNREQLNINKKKYNITKKNIVFGIILILLDVIVHILLTIILLFYHNFYLYVLFNFIDKKIAKFKYIINMFKKNYTIIFTFQES